MKFADVVSEKAPRRATRATVEEEQDQPDIGLEQPEVEYFHWAGRKVDGSAYPSSEVIHISGGARRISSDGQIGHDAEKFVNFVNGHYRTDDPEIIKALDKMLLNSGQCMSRSREDFLNATLTAAERLKRNANMSTLKDEIIAADKKEIGKLKALLEEQGKAQQTA
jgi:hypothetical protein